MPADEVHAQAAHVGGVPRLVGHLLAGRIEPGDFRRLVAVQRFAVEEAAAVERGLLVVDRDQAADEIEQLLLRGRRASS